MLYPIQNDVRNKLDLSGIWDFKTDPQGAGEEGGWFNGLDAKAIGRRMTCLRSVEEWAAAMQPVFGELYRITRPGGWVAFEVGEVRRGEVRLEEVVAPLGMAAGFECEAVLINAQRFTKTANIWGITNNRLGTNTNRLEIFRKHARS